MIKIIKGFNSYKCIPFADKQLWLSYNNYSGNYVYPIDFSFRIISLSCPALLGNYYHNTASTTNEKRKKKKKKGPAGHKTSKLGLRHSRNIRIYCASVHLNFTSVSITSWVNHFLCSPPQKSVSRNACDSICFS